MVDGGRFFVGEDRDVATLVERVIGLCPRTTAVEATKPRKWQEREVGEGKRRGIGLDWALIYGHIFRINAPLNVIRRIYVYKALIPVPSTSREALALYKFT